MLFRICRQAQNIAGAVFVLRACTVSTEILTTWIPTLSYGFFNLFRRTHGHFSRGDDREQIDGIRDGLGGTMLIRQQKATGRILSNKNIEFFI